MFDVHKATGRRIPLSALFRRPTIEQLADSIRTGSADQLDPVISPIQRGNGGLPLFAVAAPGVEILGHVLLARHMGDQPVYKIQGHHRPSEREFLYSDDELQGLALDYIDALRVFQPRGPYCLAAMCEGAHIAEKMVRELEARSEEVALFAIIDTWVLQNQWVRSRWLLYRCSRILSSTVRHLCTGQWSLLGRVVATYLRGLLTGGAGSPYAEAVWPGKDFRPGTFRAPVLLFRQPAYPYYFVNDPEMGWGKRCLSQVETCVVPCGHEEMLRKPFVAGVGQRLAQRIRDISVRAAQHVSTTRVVTEESTVSTWPAPDASR
jgi:thioesterase domain-containing protein